MSDGDATPITILMGQRQVMLDAMEALQNKVAGLDIAIAIVSEELDCGESAA